MSKDLKSKAIKIKGKSYVLVSDRVLYFNEQYENGCITTTFKILEDGMFIVTATVTPDVANPERKFIDHSQAVMGEGMINKTAALENASTSAVGRALAYMGIGVIESIASVDEINKAEHVVGHKPAKFATDKQIKWMRDTAARVSGLEHLEDIDLWIQENLTLLPKQIPMFKVKDAIDHIEFIGKEQIQEDIVITEIPDEINLDDLPV